MTSVYLPPSDVRAYAKALGWVQLDEAVKDRLYVLSNPDFPRRQIVFPMDDCASDYKEKVGIIAQKLAELYGKTPRQILAEVLTARDDAIGFRVLSAREDDPTLPLSYVLSSLSGAQQLLLSSACTVMKPQAHHPRLARAEAQQLVEHSRFRHTEEGSFVLRVSCPINALDVQAPLFPDEVEAPFVRRATVAIEAALNSIVTAIEVDTLDSFVDEMKSSQMPIVSSNLCEALTKFYDENSIRSVEIGIKWAPTLKRPDGRQVSSIKFPREYFSRIEEVGRELRSSGGVHDDTFMGTVEGLDGDLGEDGRRSGEVTLALLWEGETVRVRVNLDADDYAKAGQAHMRSGSFVRLKGRLHPGRQPRPLTDISIFEVILGGENLSDHS